jgi:hypothetical protein
MGYEERDEKEIAELAEALHCDVVWADEYTLLLDLDLDRFPGAMDQYNRMLPALDPFLEVTEKERWVSRRGKGMHIRLVCNAPLSHTQQLALQLVLGSDPRRELNTLFIPQPNCLFKPKEPVA